MTAELAIIVPALGRPHRVKPFMDSVEATVPGARVVFVCDADDAAERHAVHSDNRADLICPERRANYAQKIRIGVCATWEPLVFLAADDLEFQPGWFRAACRYLIPPVEVVGVNDLIARRPSRQRHATHFLLTREYAERPTVDGQPGPLFAGYSHSWVDNEFIETAKHRGVYVYADDAHVKHLHPMNGTAEDDETYRLGRAQFRQDRRLFQYRSRLWR